MIIDFLCWGPVPGASGGVVSFVLAFRNGHYKNDHHLRKALAEVVGGAITGVYVAEFFGPTIRCGAAFVIGLCWAGVIQEVRRRITSYVVDRLKSD